jgi:hypothetical protein
MLTHQRAIAGRTSRAAVAGPPPGGAETWSFFILVAAPSWSPVQSWRMLAGGVPPLMIQS